MGNNFQQTLKCLSNDKFVLEQRHMFVKIKSSYFPKYICSWAFDREDEWWSTLALGCYTASNA